jgi:predicted AlkP superfamily phosphohydrolase/phosphomutase
MVAVFVLPDRLGHPWWKQLVPGDALYDTRAAARIREGATRALKALDRAVGELVASLPSGIAVVACSDHGFGTLRADLFFDLVLADAGLAPRPSAKGAAIARLGRSRVGRRLPAALRRAGRTATAAGDHGVAWTATPYECGVRLAPDAPAGTAARVTELLLDLPDPDGKPLVASVSARGDLYAGEHMDRAPDLLVAMADESVDLHDGVHATSPWVSRHGVPWGTHRAEGVVAVSGQPMRGDANAADVAATVLDLLGLTAERLDGNSLVTNVGTHRAVDASVAAHSADGYSADEEAAVLEHLKGLGYVD